jgi:uncharacterized protein (DUF2062 family)
MLLRILAITGLLVMLPHLSLWLNFSTLTETYLQLTLIFVLLLWLGVYVVSALLRFSLRVPLYVVIIVCFTYVSGRLIGHLHTLKMYFYASLLVRLASRIRKTV